MGKSMRGAIFVGDGRVEVREFARPEPTGHQVLVQVKVSGLCGSDMHPFRNSAEYWQAAPVIRGHEPCGFVEQVGDCVTALRPGDRVAVYHAPGCGHCEACARGELFNCTVVPPGRRLASMTVHGSDADYVLADENMCFLLPQELSFEDGSTIACAGGTAYHALGLADVHTSEYVVVSGLGPVGLAAALLASRMGGTVIGVDPVAYRRDLAQKHGASFVIDPLQGKMAEQVKDLTGGGAEIGIETSGNDQARVDLPLATPYHARIVYVGWGGTAKNATFGPMLGERWIIGSNLFTTADVHALMRFMIRTNTHFSDLVTHRFPLERAQEAFDTFASRETGKVLFTWD